MKFLSFLIVSSYSVCLRWVYLCDVCTDTKAVKILSGSISDRELGRIEQQYCKHATVAKQICVEYSVSMKKSDTNFDLRVQSEIFTVEGNSEKLTILYPALHLKGEFVNGKHLNFAISICFNYLKKKKLYLRPLVRKNMSGANYLEMFNLGIFFL